MLKAEHRPLRIINAVAPIRICDNGGWTDTWFAGHGKIFNIAVYPYAEVQVQVYRYDKGAGADRVIIHAENYGDHYVRDLRMDGWQKHPLLEAAIRRMRVPEDIAIHLTIFSEAPGGASTGTSAAVTVALVGALDRLTPGRLTPHEVAYTAQAIETEELGQQCGIQDQLASAYGGINYIEVFQYPTASVSQIQVPNATWWELERRLALIFLGKSHSSSGVHEKVIRDLEGEGPASKRLEDLRVTAERSRDALYEGNWSALGRAMADNTAAQARLHTELVSMDAWKIIEIAREHGALGWKVNGAGGDGGSVTLLCGEMSSTKRSLIREIERENPVWRSLPIYLSRQGLRTWEEQLPRDITSLEGA
jgi:D-glycero-alpha-D-manno-heptose-7-phosphate kinase